MQREQADAGFLWDMLEAARRIVEFVHGTDERGYRANAMLRSAVERQIEIIGEAANRVSGTIRDAHPEIPWRRIIAQRHVLAHEYGEVDDGRVWLLATSHVPDLISKIEPLLPPEPPERR